MTGSARAEPARPSVIAAAARSATGDGQQACGGLPVLCAPSRHRDGARVLEVWSFQSDGTGRSSQRLMLAQGIRGAPGRGQLTADAGRGQGVGDADLQDSPRPRVGGLRRGRRDGGRAHRPDRRLHPLLHRRAGGGDGGEALRRGGGAVASGRGDGAAGRPALGAVAGRAAVPASLRRAPAGGCGLGAAPAIWARTDTSSRRRWREPSGAAGACGVPADGSGAGARAVAQGAERGAGAACRGR